MSKFDFGKNFKKGAFCIFCTAGSAVAPFALSAGQVSAVEFYVKVIVVNLGFNVKEFFSGFDKYMYFHQFFDDLAVPPQFSEGAKDDQVNKSLRRYGDREKFKEAKEKYISTFLEHEKNFCNLRDFFEVKEQDGKIIDLFPNFDKFRLRIDPQKSRLFEMFCWLEKDFESVLANLESKINNIDLRKKMRVSVAEANKWLKEVNIKDIFKVRISVDEAYAMRQKYSKISSNLINCFEKINEIIKDDEKKDSSTSSFGKSCRLVYDKSF